MERDRMSVGTVEVDGAAIAGDFFRNAFLVFPGVLAFSDAPAGLKSVLRHFGSG